jgi:hypothetical protein
MPPTIPADLTERPPPGDKSQRSRKARQCGNYTASKPLERGSGKSQRLRSGSLGWVPASCLRGGRQINQFS